MPFHTTTLFHICGNMMMNGNQYEFDKNFFSTKPIPYWQQPKTWIVYCEAFQTHLMNAVPRNPWVSAKLHVNLVNMTHQSSEICWHICKQYIKCYPYATAGVNSKEQKRVNWYHICIWKLTYCPINVLCSCTPTGFQPPSFMYLFQSAYNLITTTTYDSTGTELF